MTPEPDNPIPARRPSRRRRTRFYSVLDGREAWEIAQLSEPSLAQEMSILRIRVAELLTAEETDWKEALRAIEVLVRMVRVQQGVPIQDTTATDSLAELGRLVERLFRPDER